MYMLVQGKLNEAEEFCRTAIDRAVSEGHGDFPAAGWLHVSMARIEMERYNLDKAEVYLRDGLRIAQTGGFNEAVRSGHYFGAHLAAARGDLETAKDVLEDVERIVKAMDESYLTGELSREWAMLYIKSGNQDAARNKLEILDKKIAVTQHANLLLWRGWLYPRLLHDEGRYQEGLAALDESISRARAANSNGELIRLLSLQALVLDALGDRKLSRAALYEALELGAHGGYIWLWLRAGPKIGPMLRDLQTDPNTHQTYGSYLDSLLKACQAAFRKSKQIPQERPLDPLTPRELEILRLISKGHSNPEIANELVVTINTIKNHTSNIYSKLGVRSRTQAIARAHELNLL
jgi:LuxR family maltose regulon positive regulatory protein